MKNGPEKRFASKFRVISATTDAKYPGKMKMGPVNKIG